MQRASQKGSPKCFSSTLVQNSIHTPQINAPMAVLVLSARSIDPQQGQSHPGRPHSLIQSRLQLTRWPQFGHDLQWYVGFIGASPQICGPGSVTTNRRCRRYSRAATVRQKLPQGTTRPLQQATERDSYSQPMLLSRIPMASRPGPGDHRCDDASQHLGELEGTPIDVIRVISSRVLVLDRHIRCLDDPSSLPVVVLFAGATDV